jgi:hypothetical protein
MLVHFDVGFELMPGTLPTVTGRHAKRSAPLAPYSSLDRFSGNAENRGYDHDDRQDERTHAECSAAIAH